MFTSGRSAPAARVKFNLPLQVGATGGHGTGPYTVSSYTPATRVFSTTLQ
jgi:hypothetical protein